MVACNPIDNLGRSKECHANDTCWVTEKDFTPICMRGFSYKQYCSNTQQCKLASMNFECQLSKEEAKKICVCKEGLIENKHVVKPNYYRWNYNDLDSPANPYCIVKGFCYSNDECDEKLICVSNECVIPTIIPVPTGGRPGKDVPGEGLGPGWIAAIVMLGVALISFIGCVVYKKMR